MTDEDGAFLGALELHLEGVDLIAWLWGLDGYLQHPRPLERHPQRRPPGTLGPTYLLIPAVGSIAGSLAALPGSHPSTK
jgi:hypothetical protein